MFDRIAKSLRLGRTVIADHETLESYAKIKNSAKETGHLPSPPLFVVMCRYLDENLVRELRSVDDTQYVAISHVWGECADWRVVPGIEGDVKVSKEKGVFLAERMPSLVKDSWFWMDVLCVDQRDKAARVAVTQHIPRIFRQAVKTIAIKDARGFQSCCFDAMGRPRDLQTSSISKKFEAHFYAAHDGRHEDFLEGVLSRLWPLQEIMLSDTIQFESCPSAPQSIQSDLQVQDRRLIVITLLSNLSLMTSSWLKYGIDEERFRENPKNSWTHAGFKEAFFNCTTASRSRRSDRLPYFPQKMEILNLSSSPRRTGVARDFILAIMPQYAFYKVPADAKSMSFSQLFVDCYQQLGDLSPLSPLLACRQVGTSGPWASEPSVLDYSCPAQDIPEPFFLADFARLFLGPTFYTRRRVYSAQIMSPDSLTPSEAYKLIASSFSQTMNVWGTASIFFATNQSQGFDPSFDSVFATAVHETAAAHGRSIDEGDIPPFFHILYLLRSPQMLRSFLKSFERGIEPLQTRDPLTSILLHITALVICGLGISAFEWSKENLVPVVVNFRRKRFLGMVSKDYIDQLDPRFFNLIEADPEWGNKRYSLVGWKGNTRATLEPIPCLFPSDIRTNRWKLWK